MKKSLATALGTAVVAMIAHPLWTFLVLVVLFFLIVHGFTAMLWTVIISGAALMGIRIAVPGLSRMASGVSRRWTSLCWSTWQLILQKRMIRESERRIRASSAAGTESASVDLGRTGGDLGA